MIADICINFMLFTIYKEIQIGFAKLLNQYKQKTDKIQNMTIYEKISRIPEISRKLVSLYHVRVPEYQQIFIKFLWWENHNIEDEPSDFAMCAHVFGGVSSASCSNYALKRTATDNTDRYGQEATKVVRNNFYVDDLLKSIDDPKTAMILVKNVVDMCKSGDLTKFISNKLIPEDQRRNGVKNADLIDDLPTEKALGIQWNIPDDSFTFNIQVNKIPLTKRKMLPIISSVTH